MAEYAVTDGTSALQTEYQTSDQHDLAQEKPAVVSSNLSPSTDPSLDPPQDSFSSVAPEYSTNTLAASSTAEPLVEPQSQSRSMSRASSTSSSDPEIVTDTAHQSIDQASNAAPNGIVPDPLPSEVPVPAEPSSLLHAESVVPGDTTDVPPSTLPDATIEALDGATPRDSPMPLNAQIISPKAATSIPNLPKPRLPHDTIGLLEDRIKDDPRGDTDAWLSLIEEHKKRGKHDEARSVYKRFLELFPYAGEVWLAWVQMEIELNNRHGTDNVLGECLMKNAYLPLWSTYLDHVRRHNPLTTEGSRTIIHKAYELALRQVGIDKDSGKMWQDFIAFEKSGPGIAGGSNWQDQQKMDLLRKLYQQAICIPTQATNALWKEYDSFEMGLNKTTGRKFMQDQSPGYMSARSSYISLQKATSELKRTTLASLPPAKLFEGEEEYMTQLNIWRTWAQWEKDDPLVLKQDDPETYTARVTFVYKHALMTMRFWPELWAEASDFCFANGLEDLGKEFIASGIKANPESCLLAFKEGDRLELNTPMEDDDANHSRRAATVTAPYETVLTALYDLFNKGKERERIDVARIEAHFAEAQTNGEMEAKEDDDEKAVADAAREQQKADQIAAVQNFQLTQGRLLSRTISNVWIVLMRAMRRIQGAGSPKDGGARGVFAEARKRGRNTSELYVQAALLEFHCYDQSVAKKLFDRGLKLFADDEGFALEYIKYLVAINDHTNARVVFETVVARLSRNPDTATKAKALYSFFHDFEARYGELTQILKLEKRMRDLFPDDPKLSNFASRFQNNDFNPTTIQPVISPAKQMKPKLIPIIQAITAEAQTPQLQVASPKRALPTDDAEVEIGRPQKIQRIQRTESPLKPLTSQPMVKTNSNQHTPQQQQLRPPIPQPPYPLPPLPRDITFLLSIIPRPDTYTATKFDPSKLVGLIRETNVPNHINQLPQNGAARPAQSVAPPPAQHTMNGPPQPYGQPPSVPPMQHRPGLPPMPMQQQMAPQIGYPAYGQPPPVHYGYGR